MNRIRSWASLTLVAVAVVLSMASAHKGWRTTMEGPPPPQVEADAEALLPDMGRLYLQAYPTAQIFGSYVSESAWTLHRDPVTKLLLRRDIQVIFTVRNPDKQCGYAALLIVQEAGMNRWEPAALREYGVQQWMEVPCTKVEPAQQQSAPNP
jgi:hypothetical protein